MQSSCATYFLFLVLLLLKMMLLLLLGVLPGLDVLDCLLSLWFHFFGFSLWFSIDFLLSRHLLSGYVLSYDLPSLCFLLSLCLSIFFLIFPPPPFLRVFFI